MMFAARVIQQEKFANPDFWNNFKFSEKSWNHAEGRGVMIFQVAKSKSSMHAYNTGTRYNAMLISFTIMEFCFPFWSDSEGQQS